MLPNVTDNLNGVRVRVRTSVFGVRISSGDTVTTHSVPVFSDNVSSVTGGDGGDSVSRFDCGVGGECGSVIWRQATLQPVVTPQTQVACKPQSLSVHQNDKSRQSSQSTQQPACPAVVHQHKARQQTEVLQVLKKHQLHCERHVTQENHVPVVAQDSVLVGVGQLSKNIQVPKVTQVPETLNVSKVSHDAEPL
jgi:hypothetical protein